MYLSAQRVRSPRGATGINVALYRHEGTALPDSAWTLPALELLRLIGTEEPGKRQTARVDIAPGGNTVECFLDVVAPDGTAAFELERALAELRPDALQAPRSQLRSGNVCAEFSVNLGEGDVAAAFDALAAAAIELYREPAPPAWQRLSPLRIDVAHDDEGWRFALADESGERVRAAGGQPSRVHIRYEVADAFREAHGKIYPWVGQWVTNLTREQILELGGTRVVADGKLVDEWPKRSA